MDVLADGWMDGWIDRWRGRLESSAPRHAVRSPPGTERRSAAETPAKCSAPLWMMHKETRGEGGMGKLFVTFFFFFFRLVDIKFVWHVYTHTHRQHRDTLGDGGGWCAHPTSSFSLCLTYIKDGARTASTYPPRIPLNLKYPQYNSLMYIYVFCSSFLLDFSCLRLQMSSSNYIKFVTRCCWASLTYCINIDVQPWNEQMHLLTNYSWLPAVAEKKKNMEGGEPERIYAQVEFTKKSSWEGFSRVVLAVESDRRRYSCVPPFSSCESFHPPRKAPVSRVL